MSDRFSDVFPKLSKLVKKAIVFDITIKDNSQFQLLCLGNNIRRGD